MLPKILGSNYYNSPSFVLLVAVFLVKFSLSTGNNQTTSINLQESDNDRNNDYLVDERFPIVISNNYNIGHRDSHFGAAVTLLKYPSTDHTWLFVGEPKGNASSRVSTFNEPGVIWKCGLSFSSSMTRKEYCEMIVIEDVINKPNELKIKQNTHNTYDLNKVTGHTWLGGSLSVMTGSRSPQLITCAHRKTPPTRNSNCIRWMNGACYVLNLDQTLTQPSLISCAGTIEPVSTLGDAKCFYSAFGISLNVNQDEIFMGGPGYLSRNFIGRSSALNFSPTRSCPRKEKPEDTSYFKSIYPEKSQGRSLFNSHLYEYYGYAVTSGNYYPIPYKGITTTTNRKVSYFAGGSPRGNNLKGCVLISRTDSTRGDFVQTINGCNLGSYFGSALYSQDVDNDGRDDLFVGAPYTGQPCRSTPSASITSRIVNIGPGNSAQPSEGDLGCVYLYKYNSTMDDLQVAQILTGGNVRGSRFGTAISSIHGFRIQSGAQPKKYIVIGAPFENENGHEGAIYFYDAQKLLQNSDYVKRISASQLTSRFSSSAKRFSGFGYSFSMNYTTLDKEDNTDVDFDGNGTPDLAIGSYMSKDVVVLRTRHQIEISTPKIMIVTNDGREINLNSFQFNKDEEKFELRVHVAVTVPQILHGKEDLRIYSRISVDENQVDKRYNITQLESSTDPTQQRINNQTIVFSFLMSGTSSNGFKMSQSFDVNRMITFNSTELPPAITISVRSWYNGTAFNGLSPSRMDYSIREVQGQPELTKTSQSNANNDKDDFRPYLPSPAMSNTSNTLVNILPNVCKNHTWCQPTLHIKYIQVTNTQGRQVIGHNNSKSFDFKIGTSSGVILRWTTQNINTENETALEPGTLIQYTLVGGDSGKGNGDTGTSQSSPWSFLSLSENSGCQKVESESSFFRCTSAGIVPSNGNTTARVQLNMLGFYPRKMNQILKIRLTPTHFHDEFRSASEGQRASQGFRNKTIEVKLNLVADSVVSIRGNRYPANFSVGSGNANMRLRHSYTVSLAGNSSVREVTLQFRIPLKRNTDKENLVLVREPEISDRRNGATSEKVNNIICNPSLPYSKKPTSERGSSGSETNMGTNTAIQGGGLEPPFRGGEENNGGNSIRSRKRRSTKSESGVNQPNSNKPGKQRSLEFSNETIYLSCNDNTCMRVVCVVNDATNDTIIRIRFPLELSESAIQLLSQPMSTRTILIQGEGSAKILEGENPNTHFDMDTAQVKLQLNMIDKISAPIWIYIVAVVGGLIFIVILMAVLNACGFFKRDMKKQLITLKRQTMALDLDKFQFEGNATDEEL